MRKSKGQTVDLIYMNKKEENKKSKASQKRTTKKKKTNSKKTQNSKNEKINLDNEIIIGLTPKQEPRESKTNKNKKANKTKNKKNKENKKDTSKTKKVKKNNRKTDEKTRESRKKKSKIIKWIMIIVLFATAVVLFMLSSVFNIKEIVVINNSRVPAEEIISLSTLVPEYNMFKFTNRKIKNSIKQNAYIENVKIKRNINGTVTLDIEERTPSYMLKFANTNVYINNQGYILETSEVPLSLPILTGIQTAEENIKVGERLIVEDLRRLEDVIKIMKSAKGIEIANIITEIDISDFSNYKLTIESEGKTVQFGDCSNINVKLLKIKALIEKEKGKQGEIYFQDLERTVFREKV